MERHGFGGMRRRLIAATVAMVAFVQQAAPQGFQVPKDGGVRLPALGDHAEIRVSGGSKRATR